MKVEKRFSPTSSKYRIGIAGLKSAYSQWRSNIDAFFVLGEKQQITALISNEMQFDRLQIRHYNDLKSELAYLKYTFIILTSSKKLLSNYCQIKWNE